LHSQNPNLIQFDMLDPSRSFDNLSLAFEMGFGEFGIPKLLTPEDLQKPDEKCIMTYVSEFAYKFDILGKPVDNSRMKLLDEREQALALREAQLEKEAAERLAMATNLGEEAQRIHMEAAQKAQQVEAERMRLEQQQAANEAESLRAQEELRQQKAVLEMQTGAEKQRLQAEYDARQQALEAERQRREAELAAQTAQFQQQQQNLAAERQKLQADSAKYQQERDRFAQERREHEQKMREMQEMMAKQDLELKAKQDQLNQDQSKFGQQAALDAIEKEFATTANQIDQFIIDETQKVVGAVSLQVLEPIEKFGIPHGEEMLKKLQEVGERAQKAQLQQNRFTHHTLRTLEERWKTFQKELQERKGSLSMPVSQYAPPPQQNQFPPQQQCEKFFRFVSC
jgi:hypothetical protein